MPWHRVSGTAVKYLPPFELLRRTVEISTHRGELRVGLAYDDFVKLIRLLISGIEMDEAWYLSQNQDVAAAVQEGTIASARDHFVNEGYFEGRLPFPLVVDEEWYLATYPDVADGVGKGIIASAEQHFRYDGHREGRLPGPI
jgi:hypothetical protein